MNAILLNVDNVILFAIEDIGEEVKFVEKLAKFSDIALGC